MESITARMITLPFYNHLTKQEIEIDYVVENLRNILRQSKVQGLKSNAKREDDEH